MSLLICVSIVYICRWLQYLLQKEERFLCFCVCHKKTVWLRWQWNSFMSANGKKQGRFPGNDGTNSFVNCGAFQIRRVWNCCTFVILLVTVLNVEGCFQQEQCLAWIFLSGMVAVYWTARFSRVAVSAQWVVCTTRCCTYCTHHTSIRSARRDRNSGVLLPYVFVGFLCLCWWDKQKQGFLLPFK